ncbi:MAG TPA: 2Fe-2S iron-sulfur cluster-binding protein [Noviherbaspirillum sp.]|nr:2Fe-2S iron-sulfur cluster-binding protein [Noviherbaspirillum sp.]
MRDGPSPASAVLLTDAAVDAVEITFLTNDGKVAKAPANSNLLRVSLREKGGIPFKCGGGKCGTCKCLIEDGLENLAPVKDKERDHLSESELARGYRMACQTTILQGSVKVSWKGPVR